MLSYPKSRGFLVRMLLLISVVFAPMIPVWSSVSAQGSSAPIRVVRSLPTSEYGVSAPKGLAFSVSANTFFVLDGSSSIALITMGEDNAGTRNLPDMQDDSLNAAFDKKSDSLFMFKRGNSELVKSKLDGNGLPNASATPTKYAVKALNIKDPQGIAFDADNGRLFILDAGNSRIVSVVPHPTLGYDGDEAIRSNKVGRISLKKLGTGLFRGVAYNPGNGHLYVSEPAQKKLYELTQNGDVVSTFDLASLGINHPSAMTFAPSVDNTDDPNIYDLFVLDEGETGQAAKSGVFAKPVSAQQTASADSQIVELSLVAPMTLPPGTNLLPTTLVQVIDTSNVQWNPSAPDASGIDYWPPTGQLLISDSEVDEMPPYFTGDNVFFATTAGSLVSTCSTTNISRTGFSNEPTGVGIDRNNNRIYFSDDDADKIFEVSLGPDNTYCTSDDVVTSVHVSPLYNIIDAEDIAYGNNSVFIAGGDDAEVYRIPLGPNGVLGGGDDGAMTHFDTASLGFGVLEGIGYNWDNGTLLLASPLSSDAYIGEVTITGTLISAHDLSYLPIDHREDVTYAPGSQNPAINTFYVTDRAVDNDINPNENDGKIWEVSLPASPPSSNPLYLSLTSSGAVVGETFADEDIMKFDGVTWSQFFDGSDVGVSTSDLFAFSIVDSDTILMSFNTVLTLNGISVTPRDVVSFEATSLGSVTSGTFSMYLNGIDVGLDVTAENIDSVSLLPDGRVLISTTGSPSVPGVSGKDEDILAFTPTSLGDVTSGSWAMYFDGSDVGLATTSGEDIDALDVTSNGNIYLSALGDFAVTGVSGFDEDVFICMPSSIGSVTACNYSPSLYFDGSTWGLDANDVDAFDILESGTSPTATPTNTPTITNTPTKTSTPTSTFTPTNTNTPGPSATPTNTPTITNTPTNTSTPTSTFTPTNTPTQGPSPTPTATNTPSSDLIFADGFESGGFSAWTSVITGAGDLSVTASAALVGSNGMQAVLNDTTAMYTVNDTPNAEPRYRARFYFDPNSIAMTDGSAHYIFIGYDATAVFNMDFRFFGGSYQIRLRQQNDSQATQSTAWVTISDAPHFIEMEWWAATAAGANNGGATLWMDGVQTDTLSGLDNDTRRIERVQFGAVSGIDAGTLGTYYLDAFESRRLTYIGP